MPYDSEISEVYKKEFVYSLYINHLTFNLYRHTIALYTESSAIIHNACNPNEEIQIMNWYQIVSNNIFMPPVGLVVRNLKHDYKMIQCGIVSRLTEYRHNNFEALVYM